MPERIDVVAKEMTFSRSNKAAIDLDQMQAIVTATAMLTGCAVLRPKDGPLKANGAKELADRCSNAANTSSIKHHHAISAQMLGLIERLIRFLDQVYVVAFTRGNALRTANAHGDHMAHA